MTESLDEFVELTALTGRMGRLENQAVKAKAELAVAREQVKMLTSERDDLTIRVDTYELAAGLDPPKWLTPKQTKRSAATIVAMLSDCHFDEVIKFEENGLNKYDRRIGELRLRQFAEKVVELSRDYVAGVEIEGLVLALGGDLVSGTIHDLAQHNETPYAPVTVAHWAAQVAGCVDFLAEHFPKVHVVSVVGNHGRLTIKPRTAGRARDSWDWLLVHSAQQVSGAGNVTWQIPESHDCLFSVYSTRFLLTHGDSAKGGGGVGGIWPPIKRLQYRLQVNKPHDILMMGHWHQLVMAASAGLVVNGSLKGFDSYAAIAGFAAEVPQQAFMVVTPKHGVSIQAPIHVLDRKKEKW